MTTVTLTYTNSRNQEKTSAFDIVRRSDLNKQERKALIMDGYESVIGEDMEDEDFAKIEKQAALKAGLDAGEPFFVKMM